jgi:hypothetical protein
MMGNWTSMLKADAIMWLLEKDNPSVRYFTLKELLDKTEADPEVAEAKKAIMNQGAVPHSLAKMRQGGYWETPASFYASKYKGTVWQLLTLAELGADPQMTGLRAPVISSLQTVSTPRARLLYGSL